MTDAHPTLVDHDDGLTEGLTLLPQDDPAAREAIKTYIEATDDDAVATELQAWLDRCSDQELRTGGGTTITELAASHCDVLTTIAQLHNERPPRGTDIAANCPVDGDHIYHILQVLAERNYIDRHADHTDDRVRRVSLTDRGVAALRELKAQYAAVEVPAGHSQDTSDSQLRTDGGTPIATTTNDTDATATLGLSMFVETPTTTVDTDGEATIRVRPDHGDVRIEAAEADRTAEAVLSSSPVAMASLADELYAAAATAAQDTDAIDPLDGDPNG